MNLIGTIQTQPKTARWAGIVMFIAGILALVAPLAAGLSITLLVGAMLLIGGIAYLVLALRSGSLARGALPAVVGLMSAIAGGFSIAQPVAALAAITLFLAVFFIATGILEIFVGFGSRPQIGWGHLIISGVASLLLGLLIWAQFPLSGVWALGVLVGLRLLITGWMLTTIAGTAVRMAKASGG